MTDDVQAPEAPAEPRGARTRGRGLWRQLVFPALVVGAIVAVIWWIDYRPRGGDDDADAKYGPVPLPAEIVPAGAEVKAEAGALAPDFVLGSLEGDAEYRLSDLRGQAVVLNFWASWCKPCVKEIPQLARAYERYRDEGLLVLGIDIRDVKSKAREKAEEFGINYPVAVDVGSELWGRYRLIGLPTTFFIDREGVIRSIFMGPLLEESGGESVQGAIEESELEKRIAEILAPPVEGG
jgi:peroxiredoxin